MKRPVAQWYVLFQDNKARACRLPWAVKSKTAIKKSDLNDFGLRYDLAQGYSLIASSPDDDDCPFVFVPPAECADSDLPVHIYGTKEVKPFTIAPAIRPGSRFVPMLEGKFIFQFSYRHFSYVNGSGTWVVTRQSDPIETDLVPQFFTAVENATELRSTMTPQVGFRDVSGSSDERTGIAAVLPPPLLSGNSVGLLTSTTAAQPQLRFLAGWINSFPFDFLVRVSATAHINSNTLKRIPCPAYREQAYCQIEHLCSRLLAGDCFEHFPCNATNDAGGRLLTNWRAALDACFAELYEVTPLDYAYILARFPLLDRNQPPLPHDYRIRATKKGIEWRKMSFVTRDLALLTYFDYLAGRLEINPDPDRVARICPDGVPAPPTDIVEFFAQAGVDIGGKTEHAVAATGPFRDLRERVAKAWELGAVAYVPTIDRRRATFVERAAAAGGLSPEEGVLTPEMAQHVLRAKAERDARWQRAMQLWETTANELPPSPPVPVPQACEGSLNKDRP